MLDSTKIGLRKRGVEYTYVASSSKKWKEPNLNILLRKLDDNRRSNGSCGWERQKLYQGSKQGRRPLQWWWLDSPGVERTAKIKLIGPYYARNQLITFSLDNEFEAWLEVFHWLTLVLNRFKPSGRMLKFGREQTCCTFFYFKTCPVTFCWVLLTNQNALTRYKRVVTTSGKRGDFF